MQIENNFNNRLNTFIVLETILFGVIGLLYQKQPVNAFIVFLLIGLGLSMTLIWGYAQARQRFVYRSLKSRCRHYLEEFKKTQEEREKEKKKWPISTTTILTFFVPAVVGALWVILLLYVLLSH